MSTDIFDLTGKAALVTGAASGLGREMATALVDAGAQVLCFDLDGATLAATCAALGSRAVAMEGDVTDAIRVSAAVELAVSRFGALDIVVANAGVSDPTAQLFHEAPEDDWTRVIDVNLGGLAHLNRAALRQMMQQGSGKVINVASMWGIAGPAGLFARPAYAASKGAVVNLTRELGLEYAPHGIQVNALCPGFFRTETRPRDAAHAKIMEDYTPMGRIADASEIKGSVLYLASSASDFVTGTTLVVDGGVLAR
jgi:gluconate 5-dehydrogenase